MPRLTKLGLYGGPRGAHLSGVVAGIPYGGRGTGIYVRCLTMLPMVGGCARLDPEVRAHAEVLPEIEAHLEGGRCP